MRVSDAAGISAGHPDDRDRFGVAQLGVAQLAAVSRSSAVARFR
jgi:hypothetical protein